jgi:hypothetical protein
MTDIFNGGDICRRCGADIPREALATPTASEKRRGRRMVAQAVHRQWHENLDADLSRIGLM